MTRKSGVSGRASWCLGVVMLVLVTGAAECPDGKPVECLQAAGPLAMPFCEDLAAVPQNEYAKYHALFLAVADTLKSDPGLNVQPEGELQSREPEHSIRGRVMAFIGARDLTTAQLRERPRILAMTYTTAKYAHGLHEKYSYIVLDGQKAEGWRVLIISEDPLQPVSVLYTNVVKDTVTASVTVDITDHKSLAAWDSSLSPTVRNCKSANLGACLVNKRKTGSPSAIARDEDPINDPLSDTDVWVWLREQGCICLGTRCHSDAKRVGRTT